MPRLSNAVRYIAFIKWFKHHHPELYTRYKLQIQIPRQNKLVGVLIDYVAPQDRAAVLAAIEEYYSKTDHIFLQHA